ncbi:UPF0561 protein C2orf68 homolog [Corticium candelabrum]|uniref:UPF0561 protein C2orf68 homolog n=1 Tax=Corticium candelabrum TaxID=121492 RepID=UPI002E273D3D|nr:UPF0561 protein C2orf68 homolog [Corticium candelabrum]
MAESRCPGLNKKHGFLKVIERNQIFRDNYNSTEKEGADEKRQRAEKMTFENETLSKDRQTPSKRSVQLYVPPGRRKKDSCEEQKLDERGGVSGTPKEETDTRQEISTLESREADCTSTEGGSGKKKASRGERIRTPLFVMEVELENGKWKAFVVHKEDDPRKIATKFGGRHNLSDSIQRALEYKVRQEIDRKLTV